ncbi:MAG: beta-L-arabinofuranosidase domain-containing protein, partial [Bacteroidota bacterium]
LEDVPEMGDLVLTGEAWEQSIMWWNAETIGNWWDGFIRHAYMTHDAEAIAKAEAIVENLLASQDEDGYIGIYKPNLRYQHKGSNGELWAQTTSFRSLLGYYEISGEGRVLEAVEKAMAVTMQKYGPNGRHPFLLENAFGGVTHGLMITDVCETLYRITGKEKYQDYASWLYQAYSTYNINRAFNDLRYPFLAEKDSLFTGHGVHTYEHLRTLANAYYHTGHPELKEAYENALYKLNKAVLPSGAGHGNEWLAGLEADPTYTSAEFCCLLELRNSLSSMFQKTGDIQFADHAEKLTYNGMMGFRSPDGTAITYGKGDNCYVLDGHHHGKHEKEKNVRYKYSPTHSDPAVCCVPNYTRNLPYFLDQMWLKAADGLVAAMYAPSELQTSFNGNRVNITQDTHYPLGDEITFTIETEEKIPFAIYLRKPAWTENIDIDCGTCSLSEEKGFVKVEKEWEAGEQLIVSFVQEVQQHQLANKEAYIQRGPLVYAYPIPHREEVIKMYEGTDYTDYYCYPQNTAYQSVSLPKAGEWTYAPSTPSEVSWYGNRPELKSDQLTIVPMGSTVLRRVTFPSESK